MSIRDEPIRFRLEYAVQLMLGVLVLRPFLRFSFRARVRFAGEMPAGGFIMACNHRSFLDPSMAAMWLDRPISFFARASLWKIPVVRQFLNAFGGLPIERDAPQMQIMRQTVEWLRAGRRILVFPEGTRTRSGRLGPMRDGAAMFARRAGVPVVPVYIHNSEGVWPRGMPTPLLAGERTEIRYGRPIYPPEHLPARQRDAVVTEYLRRWMARQERELRGPA